MIGQRKRRVLVITASANQVPVILKARSLGLEVVATDRDAGAPGLAVADVAEVLDSEDLRGTLAIARRYQVTGVITEQTDVAVPTAAYVAEELGLPGIGYNVSIAATNKWVMRERCRKAGMPTPQYALAKSLPEAIAAAREIGLPVVIKPISNQASRGVAKIWDIGDIPEWFEKAWRFSRGNPVLIEEMMVGTESSVESFVENGNIRVLAICDKTKCPPPYSYDLQLVYPGLFPDEILTSLHRMNELAIRAVGITIGITHAEFMVTSQGVRLIEIAARGCGARVATELIPAMTGVDLMAARIRQAVGDTHGSIDPLYRKSGVLKFFIFPKGRVKSIHHFEQALQIEGVVNLVLNVKTDDIIGPVESGDARHGYVLTVAGTREEALSVVEDVAQTLQIEIDTS